MKLYRCKRIKYEENDNYIQKLIKRKVKEGCRKFEAKRVEEIIEETWSTRKMKRELAKGIKLMTWIKNKDGKLITGRDEIMNEITEFYRNLYSAQNPEEELGSIKDVESTQLILRSEVERVIKLVKLGKKPGPDKINNSFLKTFGEVLLEPGKVI